MLYCMSNLCGFLAISSVFCVCCVCGSAGQTNGLVVVELIWKFKLHVAKVHENCNFSWYTEDLRSISACNGMSYDSHVQQLKSAFVL